MVRDPSLSVLLFPDTFTNFFEPAIGEAAIELLRRTGCSVTLGPPGLRCCGRPLISNGLLDQAVAHARHNVHLLHEWSQSHRGGRIIACEPSCILTIRDDYPALLKGELRSRAEAVAGICTSLEEVIESRIDNGAGRGSPDPAHPPTAGLQVKAGPRRILVQSHCHQRSLVGTGPTLAILRAIPDADVIDLDAGCCGMAGSFGYEIEHYEVSRLVGERRLFPTVRQADPNTVIVAPGFSCRLQIQHFTGPTAMHPAELLRSCLA